MFVIAEGDFLPFKVIVGGVFVVVFIAFALDLLHVFLVCNVKAFLTLILFCDPCFQITYVLIIFNQYNIFRLLMTFFK